MKVINDKVGGIIRKPLALVLSADTYKSGAKFVVQKSLSIPLQVYKLRKLWVKKVDSANKLTQLIKLQMDYSSLLMQQEALKGMQISDVRRQRMQNNINLGINLQIDVHQIYSNTTVVFVTASCHICNKSHHVF
jgi:hypothetical protein